MKKLLLIVVLFLLNDLVHATPNAGDLGVGIVAGDLTGPTLKLFTGRNTALDMGLGFSSNFEAYADYVWHSWNMFPRPESGMFGGYIGVGPRFKDRDGDGPGDSDNDQFGIRTMGGIDYWTASVPLELFLEVGPWFIFTPDTDTELDLGLGVRYYFLGQSRNSLI